MSIDSQVFQRKAAFFLQEFVNYSTCIFIDVESMPADSRLTKRTCLVQLDQLLGSILTVLAQKPFNWLSVGRDGHVMIANESYNSFFAGVIEAKSTPAGSWRTKSTETGRISAIARRMGSVFPARLWGGPRRVKPETRLRTIGMSASAWKWSADSLWRSVNVAWGWSPQSCGRLRPM